MNYIETKELKDRLRKGEPAVALRKVYAGANEPMNARQIKFTISTSGIDRDFDRIEQDGWVLDNYLNNPVVLLNHKASELPIAKCTGIGIENGSLKATVEFVPAAFPVIGELAEAVYQLCLGGYLNATSVGFQPIKWDWAEDDDGIVFSKQELLEFSIVSVPSNPQALIDPPAWFAIPDKQAAVLNTHSIPHARLRLRLLHLDD